MPALLLLTMSIMKHIKYMQKQTNNVKLQKLRFLEKKCFQVLAEDLGHRCRGDADRQVVPYLWKSMIAGGASNHLSGLRH